MRIVFALLSAHDLLLTGMLAAPMLTFNHLA